MKKIITKILGICTILGTLTIACNKSEEVSTSSDQNNSSQDSEEDTSNKDDSTQGIVSIISPDDWEELFPNRYGKNNSSTEKNDFFSYESFLNAIDLIGDIKITIYQREGVAYCYKIKWENKSNNTQGEYTTHPDYNAEWNLTKKEISHSVDFSEFCNIGSTEQRKQELAAFFANISHETTGGGQADKEKNKGLWFREEIGCESGGCASNYNSTNSPYYQPVKDKSYHGRGPIQLSYPYNYGQFSQIAFAGRAPHGEAPKDVLLKDPDLLLKDNGTLAFESAIWFWMMPQAPKPSCHEVMVGTWTPTAEDNQANRTYSKFGMTINIINGGLECNSGWDARGEDRVGFYERYCTYLKIKPEPVCDCQKMKPY